ncbi:HD domain-containing phosphohydrolase [Desulfogranum japonicum]|uniref:HD domain-containing phosphohydrolase n=1 Tax=Desulfogranum japonicum TaxID=231447 RepID=UPI00040CA2AC|nr:HD domain-containing phosphohydrolase [Desulfogranum japonicum]
MLRTINSRLNFDWTFSFLRSRIARRFLFLFLTCAFVPTVFLFVYSLHAVEKEIEEQRYIQLERDSKAYGMALLDRLKHICDLLLLTSDTIFDHGQLRDQKSKAFYTQLEDTFVGISMVSLSGTGTLLMGELNLAPIRSEVQHYLSGEFLKPMLYAFSHGDEGFSVYVLYPGTMQNGVKMVLIAQARHDVLWGTGNFSVLPAQTELAVYEGKRQIVATPELAGQEDVRASFGELASLERRLLFTLQEEEYVAACWPLFLTSHFEASTWTILLAQKRDYALKTIIEFKRVFPLIILCMVWVVLFFSLNSIRRTLEPLAELRAGTLRIMSGNLASPVRISSNDEFGELGRSFNKMSKQLHRQMNTLTVIDRIDRAILSSLDVHEIITRALIMMRKHFGCTRSYFSRLADTNQVQVFALEHLDQKYPKVFNWPMRNPAFRTLMEKGSGKDKLSPGCCPSFLLDRGVEVNDRLYSFPIRNQGQIVGVIILEIPFEQQDEVDDVLSQIRQVADQLGIALGNARLVHNLERLSIGTVEALARTVDAKSEWTAGHSERVAKLAVQLAAIMGCTPSEQELLYRGGLLHDIGKIGIPLLILDKPGKLDKDEYETIKKHPVMGGKILEPIDAYQDILKIVVQHHERYDGKGYPFGLKGDAIDPLARILSVADVYDALITSRPYRDGWPEEEVTAFMQANSGVMFQPDVVDALMVAVTHES